MYNDNYEKLADLFQSVNYVSIEFKMKKYDININDIKDNLLETTLWEKAVNVYQCEYLEKLGLEFVDENGGILFHCNNIVLYWLLDKGMCPVNAINKLKTRLGSPISNKSLQAELRLRLNILQQYVAKCRKIVVDKLNNNISKDLCSQIFKLIYQ